MGVRERDGKFFVDYYCDGRRVREFVGTSGKEAGKVLTLRKADILSGKFHLPVANRVTFSEVVVKYMEWAKQHKRSWQDDEEMLRRMTKEFGTLPLQKISRFQIEGFKTTLLKEGLSGPRVNRYLATLSGLFRRALEWDLIRGTNPVKLVKRFRENPGRIRYLKEEEIARLKAVCSADLWDAVVLAMTTGLRAGELFDLQWDNVDMENRIVRVVDSKNGDRRDVPMSETVFNLLKARKHTGDRVLSQPDGKPHMQKMRPAFARACKKAGLEGLRWHDLRHSFASHLVMGGASIFAVQQLLGHRTLSQTRRYSHLSPGVLQDAVSKMDKVMGGAAEPAEESDGHGLGTLAEVAK